MTKQSAIDKIKCFPNRNLDDEWLLEEEMQELSEMAILALEKQIPKKITHEATIYKCCTCPSCKNVVDEFETIGDSRVRVTFQFCHFCGQALDWNS